MQTVIDDQPVHLYTGARPFDRRLPTLLLLHGAGHDHSVWNAQARHLAHHGFGVLAPDLPGHGQSGGTALPSIEALADWVLALLDALGLPRVALAGHSMGSLIALESAARLNAQGPERLSRLALLGSVVPMPVAQPLLEAARTQADAAHRMINQWSYAPAHQLGASPQPGMVLPHANAALMRRQPASALATDLNACNAYTGGTEALSAITQPVLLLCGERDQMTPPRASRALATAFGDTARLEVLADTGHALMAEAPDAVNRSLRRFFLGG